MISKEDVKALSDDQLSELINIVSLEKYHRNKDEILERQKKYREDSSKEYAGAEYSRKHYKKNKKEYDKKKKDYVQKTNNPSIEKSKEAGIYKTMWSPIEEDRLMKFRNNGMTYQQISDIMGRSVVSLKTRYFKIRQREEAKK